MKVEKRDGRFIISLTRDEAEELYKYLADEPVGSNVGNQLYALLEDTLPLPSDNV